MSQVTREEHNTPHIRHTGVASQAYSDQAVVIMTAKAGGRGSTKTSGKLSHCLLASRSDFIQHVLGDLSRLPANASEVAISKCAAHLWVDWVGSETTDAGGVDAAGFSSPSELARRWGESALPGFSPEVYAVGHSFNLSIA